MAHQIQTIGGIGDLDASPEAIATQQVFAGATNRGQIAAYMGALAWEKFLKGVAVGFVGGAVVAVGLAVYLKK